MQSRLLQVVVTILTLAFLTGCAGNTANVNRALACLAIGGVLGATAGAVIGDEDSEAAIIVPGVSVGMTGAALCGLFKEDREEVGMQEVEREKELADIGVMDMEQERKVPVVEPEKVEEAMPAPIAQVLDGDGDGVLDDEDRCPDSLPLAKVDADGCAQVGELMAVLQEPIHFSFDRASLRHESIALLDKVAEALQSNPNIRIDVVGHTDSIGTEAYNLQLGQRRAQAAQNYLVNKGVAASQLRLLSKGESQPIANNINASGRALNRRVEFIVNGKHHGQ